MAHRESPLDGMNIAEYDAYQTDLAALLPKSYRVEEARKLRRRGKTLQSIGDELGVSRQRVHQMLKEVRSE